MKDKCLMFAIAFNAYIIVAALSISSFMNYVYASEDDVWLRVHVISKHIGGTGMWVDDYGQEHYWNEANPGLGIEYEVTDHLAIATGVYYNSHKKVSVYGGPKWHTSYNKPIAIGIGAGIVTGYEITQNVEGPISAYVHPTISWIPKNPYVGGRPFRLDVGYVPAINIGQKGDPTAVLTVSFALKY